MATIQVKHVPDDVHQVLRRRAAAAGQSLQEYVLAALVSEARLPSIDELLDDVATRADTDLSFDDVVDAVRAERDGR